MKRTPREDRHVLHDTGDSGMRISIDDPEAKKFRASNIEWLMLNHPHDCPVCDEGGECHLQDMTVMTGHTYRRTRFKKRTYRNQYLGPFINHEMNRCIQCYRCVRFYRDYAGGRDFDVFASHDHGLFRPPRERHPGKCLQRQPRGDMPDRRLHGQDRETAFTRKWDLQTAPSVCVHCGSGLQHHSRRAVWRARRIRNRYNGQVNGYFLCDRGRYGYEFVNSPQRVRQPLIKDAAENSHRPASREQALEYLREVLSNSKGIIGIGSPPGFIGGKLCTAHPRRAGAVFCRHVSEGMHSGFKGA